MTEPALATAARRDTDHAVPQSAPLRKATDRPDMAPPPVPATALHDPAMAHPANATLRSATMHEFQRGVGNRAVQAAVAGLAGRMPQREAKPREQEAREDESLDTAQDERAEPHAPPLAAPLTVEPLHIDYDVSERLDLGTPGPVDPHHAARVAEAEAAAQHAYAALRHHGQSLYRATLDDANHALDTVAGTHADATARFDTYEQTRLEQVETAETAAIASVEQTADATVLRMKASHDAAVKALVTIVRDANGHVGALNAHAQQEKDKVVGHAQSLYSEAFKTAGTECDTQESDAEKNLKEWLKKLDDAYPPKGDALHIAYAEARRKTAPALVDNDIAGLKAMRESVHKSYKEVEPKLTGQVGTALGDAIAKNVKAGIDKGYETIASARKHALQGLEQQLREGLHAAEQMRRGGRASVRSEGKAARARVSDVVRARKTSLRADADRSMEGVSTGVQPALRLYAASTERFAGMLQGARRRGPEGLMQTASTAPHSIRAAMDNAQRMHADRVTINAAAMRGMLTNDEQQCAVEAEAEMTRARRSLNHVVQEVTPELEGTAASQGAAFTTITDNVRTTGETWAKSYAGALTTSMTAFQKAADESFDTFMTGALPKGAKPQEGEKAVPFDMTKKGIADANATRRPASPTCSSCR
jgi:hypothetical protein